MNIDTLKKHIEAYLLELKSVGRKSDNTLNSYQNDLEQFTSFIKIEDQKVVVLNKSTLKKYLFYLDSLSLNTASISRKLSSLRGLMKYFYTKDIINENLAQFIKSPKLMRKLPEILPLDSYLEIIRLIKKSEESEVKPAIIIFELLYGSALRVSELCNLKISNVNFLKGYLKVKGKGSKERIVPLGTKAQEYLSDYLKSRKSRLPDDSLILTKNNTPIYPRYVQRLVKKYFSLVSNLSKQSPHVLRHTAATHMLDNGADLMAVKELLGHSSLSTTQIYTHVSIDKLKKTHKSSHPKS